MCWRCWRRSACILMCCTTRHRGGWCEASALPWSPARTMPSRRRLSPGLEWLRKRCAGLMEREPGELADLLVTRYPPGAGIGWHRDAPQFGEVSGVSLLTACGMQLRHGQAPRLGDGRTHPRVPLRVPSVRSGAGTMAAPHPCGHAGAVVDDVPHPAARCSRHTVSGSTRQRTTVHVHARARTEPLEWDGPTLQLWVREPPAGGRANAAVTRAVGAVGRRRALSSGDRLGATARHKLVEIQCENAFPAPAV